MLRFIAVTGFVLMLGVSVVATGQVSPSDAPPSEVKPLVCVAAAVTVKGRDADVNVESKNAKCSKEASTLSSEEAASILKDSSDR